MTYGCFNRKPYKDHVVVDVNRVVDGVAVFAVTHPFRMSRECQYTKSDLGRADTGCYGCMWRTHNGADKRTPKP